MDRTEYEFYLIFVNTVQFHGGFGIGIERMKTFAAGTKHIREAIPFPRMLHRIKLHRRKTPLAPLSASKNYEDFNAENRHH
ncbi:MAG: amino acid--tRNA ligase-related protein [Streptococcus sp.]